MTQAQIGVYGLGTMGSSLALNLAESGCRVAVSNREPEWLAPFLASAGDLAARITARPDLATFVAALERPRAILFMIPSGAPMDQILDAVLPMLAPEDIVIDAGNADFNDTRRRQARLAALGLHFVGMGVSGGKDGARHGPSMMVGCDAEPWARLEPILTGIAARYRGQPCVARLGPDGAGHFVKTVHNGIEYADMQTLAEIYGLLRDGAGWDAPRIGALVEGWNDGPLQGFLVEITARVLRTVDPDTGRPLVDLIADSAGQKGTGRWTVIEALKLGQSASTIEAAVGARSWSALGPERRAAAEILRGATPAGQRDSLDGAVLEKALLAARILGHAQGFSVMQAASDAHGWDLDLARVAEIWRAGCIIRSALLDDIAQALRDDLPQGQLILAPGLATRLNEGAGALRQVVGRAVEWGLPVPALAAALTWFDTMRQAHGSTPLIQAQRDFFGAHGFERLDKPGSHHGSW